MSFVKGDRVEITDNTSFSINEREDLKIGRKGTVLDSTYRGSSYVPVQLDGVLKNTINPVLFREYEIRTTSGEEVDAQKISRMIDNLIMRDSFSGNNIVGKSLRDGVLYLSVTGRFVYRTLDGTKPRYFRLVEEFDD